MAVLQQFNKKIYFMWMWLQNPNFCHLIKMNETHPDVINHLMQKMLGCRGNRTDEVQTGCRGNRTDEVQTLQCTYQKDKVSTYLRWHRGHLDRRTHPSEVQRSLCRARYLRWPRGHLDRRIYLSEVYARKAYAKHKPYHASWIVQIVKITTYLGLPRSWKYGNCMNWITSFIFI